MVQNPRLIDQVRGSIRKRHLNYRTEQAYVMWINQFIHFHNCTHPQELGPLDIEAFLSHLALDRHAAPSLQNQALNAIVFLYTHVQMTPLGKFNSITRTNTRTNTRTKTRTKTEQRPPVVFSPAEAKNVLS